MKKVLFILLLLVVILESCTLEKRHYRSGYYCKMKNSKLEEQLSVSNSEIKSSMSVTRNLSTNDSEKKQIVEVNGPHPNSATSRTKKVNPEIKIQKVLETICTKALPTQLTKKIFHKNNIDATTKSTSGGKSQLVALLLVLFVGVLGIHRFYLGYIGIGIIQLLTLGCCGIWTLIDLIMIATGSLKPKDGEYDEKF